MVKVVIFDLDDTLIKEKDFIKSGYNIVAQKISKDYNINKVAIFNLLKNEFEKDHKNVFNRTMDALNILYTNEYILELVKTYREHIPNITLDDEYIKLLEILKQKNIKTAIITDGYKITQINKVQALGLDNKIDKIIYTDELGREYWKPNPKAFEMIRKHFDCDYSEMIYIGDNPEKDFYIKKYFPIKTFRILNKESIYYNSKYLEKIHEDIRISKLNDILEILT